MAWNIGGAYLKTRTTLIEKIKDVNDFEVLIDRVVNEGYRGISKDCVCYFCRGAIGPGNEMYEVTRNFVRYGEINQMRVFSDLDCMAGIRGNIENDGGLR